MTSKTPAMLLQELSTKMCGRGPDYQLLTLQHGTHENVFEYIVDCLGITASARGRSKKEAKQEAARIALLELKTCYNIEDIPTKIVQNPQQISPDGDGELPKVFNYKGEVDDMCLKYGLPTVEYILISDSGPPHQKVFTYEGRLSYKICVHSTASTKKQAKQNVAKKIYDRLSKLNLEPGCMLKLKDFPKYFKIRMEELKLTQEQLEPYLQEPPTEEKLLQLLEAFELTGTWSDLTEFCTTDLFVVTYSTNAITASTAMGTGSNFEEAKQNAVLNLFKTIRLHLGF